MGEGPSRYGRILRRNSSTTPLANGETFTGDWADVADSDGVVVAVATDQDGTYSVQYSTDAINVDSTLTRYYRTSSFNVPHRFSNARRFARVVFTNNSGTDQTYFRLQTMVGGHQPLNIPIDGPISRDYDATVVRPTDTLSEVAIGRWVGQTLWNKWGYNADVDTGATETIWAVGGVHTRLTTASTLTVVSSAAGDDAGSTGAGAVIIYGIDANWMPVTEVVVMDGTTPVITTSTWLGINRVAVYNCGTSLINEGNITITATTGGTTQAYVPASEGSTQQLIFFVPADHQAIADWLYVNVAKISGGGSPVVTIKMWVYSDVSTATYEVFRTVVDTAVDNHVTLSPKHPFPVGEKSYVYLTADTTADNTTVSARVSFVTIKDSDAT